MGYEILEHTADAKFRATGETLEEAFSETVMGFAEIVGDGERGQVRHEIEVESENLEALLFDFMDRLILLQDTEGVTVREAENLEIEEKKHGYALTADIMTDKLDPGGSYLDVKGPTYNEMKVEQGDGEWVIEAVLDI
ncbi:MAG: archease [Candidatus Nanohaloarchaea archaeon]